MATAPQATTRIRVPFVDIDSSQRIHFTALFRYFEIAEHTLMRAIGQPYATMLDEVAYPRVSLTCDIKRAIVFDDQIDVTAAVERVGSSSWTVAFTVRAAAERDDAVNAYGVAVNAYGVAVNAPASAGDAAPDERPIIATGRMTIVTMDPITQRSRPLPTALRRALTGE